MQEEITENQKFDPLDAPDWFLQQLVKNANDANFTLTVTLFIGGSIVSGTIVNGAEFFDRLGEQIQRVAERSDHNFAEEMGSMFKSYGQVYRNCLERTEKMGRAEIPQEGAENTQEDPDPLPLEKVAYIHLKNVKMITPEGRHIIFNPPSAVWRGRISSVDGFMCGSSVPEQ